MKKIFTLFAVAAMFTGCAVTSPSQAKLTNTATHTKVNAIQPTVAVFADLQVAPNKISYFFLPSQTVQNGGFDNIVNTAVREALIANGITPIMCCGESLETFEEGKTEEWVRGQIKAGLDGLTAEQVADMVIAYEPIWAIGTGKSATKEIAEATCAIVRDEVRKNFGDEAADKVRIQYGGSVKPNNIAEYMAEPDIDGALIGGASLKVDSFTEIIEAVK